MKRSIVALSLIVAFAVSSSSLARAACDPAGADAVDVANARAAVAANCDCAGATSHGAYVKCAGTQATATLVNAGCASTVKRCASRSTCGRPGYVTCCRTNSKGVTKCSIKKGAAKCKAPNGGSACAGILSSCCDACQPGGCVGTTTSTSTSVTSSTCTSTTLPQPCQPVGGGFCGGACSTGQTCQDDGMGGCSCVGPPVACGDSNHAVCSTGVCPVGESCNLIVDNAQCGIVHCGCDVVPTTTSTTSTSVTSSTCTSTTTFPPCHSFGGGFCGGACSTGQTCQDDGSGTNCTCVGPPVDCGLSHPAVCSTGVCPVGQTCGLVVVNAQCGIVHCGCN
jgi:hypothetical protein